MDIEKAAEIAEKFLAQQTTSDKYFRVGDDGAETPKVSLQHVTANAGKLDVLFMVDEEGTETDPEVVALVDEAMSALRAAHPELAQFELECNTYGP